MFVQMAPNVYVYGKLRVCVRGFSEGKSEASKQATNFGLAKTSNFLYTVLPNGFYFVSKFKFSSTAFNSAKDFSSISSVLILNSVESVLSI